MSSSVVCAVGLCDNTFDNCRGLNISFHSFPKDQQIRAVWLKALGKSDDFKSPPNLRICSAHFTPDSFHPHTAKLRRLKRNAVPIILNPNDFKRARLVDSTLLAAEIFPGEIGIELGGSSSEAPDAPELVLSEGPTQFHTYATKKFTMETASQVKPKTRDIAVQVYTIDLGLSRSTQCDSLSSSTSSPTKSSKSSLTEDMFYDSEDDWRM